jgi:hypothetical protein
MRKMFGLIIFALFITTAVSFIFLLNIKITLLSAEKVKNTANRSNVYEVVAAALRQSISEEANVELKEGSVLEQLTNSINTETVRTLSEDAIDQIFTILADKNAQPKIVLRMSVLEKKMQESMEKQIAEVTGTSADVSTFIQADSLGGDQAFDIGKFPLAGGLQKYNRSLMILAATLILYALLLYFIVSKNNSVRLIWLGSTMLFIGIFFALITYASYKLVPGLFDRLIDSYQFKDPKIITGATKLFLDIIDGQKIILIIETATSLLLGIGLIILGRSIKEEKIQITP